MEAAAAGAVARKGAFCPADAVPFRRVARAAGCAGSSRVSVRRPGGFADQGHLRYYAPSTRCGGMEEEKRVVKRRSNLVKELAVLQAAAGGLGVEGATPGETGERRTTLEEAADVLLAHLELMRAEEKEMKRRRKEEKKAAKRAAARQMGVCDDDSEDSEDEQERKERDGKTRDCNGCKNSDHKEMKRKKKQQKAAILKAACKKKTKDCDESESSSSSSESSDCEEEVMDSLRRVPAIAEPVPEEVQVGIMAKDEFSLPTAVSRTEEGVMVDAALKCAFESISIAASGVGPGASTSSCCSNGRVSVPVMAAEAAALMDSLRRVPAIAEPVPEEVQVGIMAMDEFSLPTAVSRTEEGVMVDVALKCASAASASASACCSNGRVSVPVMAAEAAAPMGRIEVCMGGKCKKSGAVELMQTFERRLGMGGAVAGCKCMGKCREGPNVRIRNVEEGDEGDESMKAVRNPLCLGVGLDDVGAIVAKFFGEEIQKKKDVWVF